MFIHASLASAEVQLGTIQVSSDITIRLAAITVADESIAEIQSGGPVTLRDIGALPAAADVTAFHQLENGDRLLAIDTTAALSPSVTARPGDVVRFDGNDFSIEFSATSMGIAGNARLDALTVNDDGDLLVSFDITIAAGAVIADDEDLLRYDGNALSLFLDGSSVGISPSLDLDAVHHVTGTTTLLMSFDTSGTIAGVNFDDDDLLAFDWSTETWSLVYVGSDNHAAWASADLDAVFVTSLSDVIFKDGFE